MHAWHTLLPTLLLVLPVTSASAKAEHFRIEPVHTRVAFQVSHDGFSNPIGSFSGSSGELDFDPDSVAADHVDVRIPIATLNLGDSDWQGKILDATFFDAKKFPEARFVSTHVEKTGDAAYTIDGTLTLHGVSHPVQLQATFNALKRHPLTFRRTIGFSASGTLKRSDFGMTSWSSLVGDDIRLLIEIEAQKAATPDDHEPSSEAHDAVTK
jgi:polyisoprenoid-binding protein YceI